MRPWSQIKQQIGDLEGRVRADVRTLPVFTELKTICGIGDVLGMTIALETGPIERCASPCDYASYCRMVESRRISDGKRKGRGNARCGNRYLCGVFVEAVNFAVRFNPPAARWYERKRARKHRIVAVKAAARIQKGDRRGHAPPTTQRESADL